MAVGDGVPLVTTDWDGARYRRVNTLQQWLAARALDDVDLDGVQRLLDVGCGDGRVTEQLAARLPTAPGVRCVGIDPSPGMIAVAPTGPRLEFEVGDVTTMVFADEFDLVVSFNALHWVLDQRQAWTVIARALHTGTSPGRCLAVFVCAGPRPSLEDVAMTVAHGPSWVTAFEGFAAPYVHPDPAVWRSTAEAAGLDVERMRVDDLEWDFGSREAFTAWCTVGFGAWTSRLTDEEAPRFMADVVDAYAAATGSPQTFRFMQLVASLRRTRA
ncbi:MAG: methyltransferase domain-containing protein [Lapillicoccus sp.]